MQLLLIINCLLLSFFHLVRLWLFHVDRAHILLHVNLLHETVSYGSVLVENLLEGPHIHLTLRIQIFVIVYIREPFVRMVIFLLLVSFENDIHLTVYLLVVDVSVFFFVVLEEHLVQDGEVVPCVHVFLDVETLDFDIWFL